MPRKLSEWARAQKVILSILTTLVVSVGGTAGVMAGSPAQTPDLAEDLAACETRVSALEAAIAANRADHEAILRTLGDLRTDIRDMRGAVK